MKTINIGDIVTTTSGSKIKIINKKAIERKGKEVIISLSEQYIGDKLIAYEVAVVRVVKESIFKEGKWINTGEMKESYPSSEAFGKNKIERNLPKRCKVEIEEYFNSLT